MWNVGRYLVCGWLLWLGALSTAQAMPLRLDGSDGGHALQGHLEAFFDPTGALTQSEVSSAEISPRFSPLPGNFNGGFAQTGAWWLRVAIETVPRVDQEWWLWLNVPYVDYVDVWLPTRERNGKSGLTQRSFGGLRPVRQRDLPWSLSVVRLNLAPSEAPQWIWIRLAGQRTLSLSGEVTTLKHMAARYQVVVLQVSSVIGMMLMMTVVALMLGVTLQDRTFVWYSAYLGSSALLFLCSENFLSAMLLPEHPLIAVRTHSFAMCLGLFTSVVFAHSLLRMPREFPRIGVAFRVIAGLALVGCGVAIIGAYGRIAPALNLLRLLLAILTIALCVILVKRGRLGAWPNLVGFSVYGAVGLLHFAKNLNWLPFTLLTQYSYLIGVVVHMLAIFLSLGLRVRSRERQALADSLDAGARLEASVAERTRELQIEVKERQRAESRLEQAMAEQRNFLSMVSHELRNPLSIVGASAEMISDERFGAQRGEVQREAEKIGRAKQRMLGLVETLLADEWLNSSAVQLNRTPLDLGDLLADRVEEQSLASRRDILLDAPDDELPVSADERLLHVVFDNLIDNAIKYSPGDTAIMVSACCQDDRVRVSVRDHGDGFDAADLDHVFQRFWRAGAVRRKPGVGLGLYMVRRIVELHGGTVRAANAAEGAGAVLVVTLPAA